VVAAGLLAVSATGDTGSTEEVSFPLGEALEGLMSSIEASPYAV
jgi:hypothetical protein